MLKTELKKHLCRLSFIYVNTILPVLFNYILYKYMLNACVNFIKSCIYAPFRGRFQKSIVTRDLIAGSTKPQKNKNHALKGLKCNLHVFAHTYSINKTLIINKLHYFRKKPINTAMSAGETPGIPAALARLSGRIFCSFSRASYERFVIEK